MLFVCYPNCKTCQKARKWLEENGIGFEERHIKEDNPTIDELKDWHKKKRHAAEKVLQYQRNAV